jgi:hypothetical protein
MLTPKLEKSCAASIPTKLDSTAARWVFDPQRICSSVQADSSGVSTSATQLKAVRNSQANSHIMFTGWHNMATFLWQA